MHARIVGIACGLLSRSVPFRFPFRRESIPSNRLWPLCRPPSAPSQETGKSRQSPQTSGSGQTLREERCSHSVFALHFSYARGCPFPSHTTELPALVRFGKGYTELETTGIAHPSGALVVLLRQEAHVRVSPS